MIDVMAKLKEIAESGYDNEDIQRGIDAAATQVFAEEEAEVFEKKSPGGKKKLMRSAQKFSDNQIDELEEDDEEAVEEDAVEEVHEDVEEDTSLDDMLKLAGRSGVIGMKTPTAMISESLEFDEEEVDEAEEVEEAAIEEEAVEETVAVPVQALEELMRLAGYENYEAKIDEYENDPEPEYMDAEEQMMGLSGGLNGPKKMYPASADGDNPMDQEPREIEESLAESFYTEYSQMIEELMQEDD